jgi:hypothetical protein
MKEAGAAVAIEMDLGAVSTSLLERSLRRHIGVANRKARLLDAPTRVFLDAPATHLASTAGPLRGPDRYRILEWRRRRAQIRARREMGLI